MNKVYFFLLLTNHQDIFFIFNSEKKNVNSADVLRQCADVLSVLQISLFLLFYIPKYKM